MDRFVLYTKLQDLEFGIFKKCEILYKKNFSQESMNDIFNQSFEQMMNPQTKVFSLFIIVVLHPILTSALMSSHFLGTVLYLFH
jgi:hypothetical protein